nr:3-oxoacyl-[acyl-carrier-protein] synthase I, chloroplastic-like [Ipomoea batatas]
MQALNSTALRPLPLDPLRKTMSHFPSRVTVRPLPRYCIVAGKKADLKVDGIGKVRVRSDPVEPPNNPHTWSARGSSVRADTRLRLRRLGPLRL